MVGQLDIQMEKQLVDKKVGRAVDWMVEVQGTKMEHRLVEKKDYCQVQKMDKMTAAQSEVLQEMMMVHLKEKMLADMMDWLVVDLKDWKMDLYLVGLMALWQVLTSVR